MNTSADAAEQVVRMTLNGVEVAARITGRSAERIATLLYAMSRDQKQTKSHLRLSEMLKSEKPFKVFAVKDGDLKEFCRHAKRYGIRYCVIKDRSATDGTTDLLIGAENAAKVNRIFDRYLMSAPREDSAAEVAAVLDESPEPIATPTPARTERSHPSAPTSATRSTCENSTDSKKPSVRKTLQALRAAREQPLAQPRRTPPAR